MNNEMNLMKSNDLGKMDYENNFLFSLGFHVLDHIIIEFENLHR